MATIKQKEAAKEGTLRKPRLLNGVHGEKISRMRRWPSAAKLVILWFTENLHAPDNKLKDAFECAMRMCKYEHKKAAD